MASGNEIRVLLTTVCGCQWDTHCGFRVERCPTCLSSLSRFPSLSRAPGSPLFALPARRSGGPCRPLRSRLPAPALSPGGTRRARPASLSRLAALPRLAARPVRPRGTGRPSLAPGASRSSLSPRPLAACRSRCARLAALSRAATLALAALLAQLAAGAGLAGGAGLPRGASLTRFTTLARGSRSAVSSWNTTTCNNK